MQVAVQIGATRNVTGRFTHSQGISTHAVRPLVSRLSGRSLFNPPGSSSTSRYVDIWQHLGYRTYGYRPSTSSILLPPVGSVKAAKFTHDVYQFQESLAQPKLLYHIFSNAGFLFMGTVLRAMADSNAKLAERQPDKQTELLRHKLLNPVQGIIFDSAPCRLTPDISARGFTAAVLSRPAASIVQHHPRLVTAAQAAFTPVLKLPVIANRQNEVWESWQTTAPTSPQLYLYSSADALIPPEEVQKFQRMQATRGVKVSEKLWTDSAHCEHFRMHPEAYTHELQTFANSVQHCN